MIVFCYNYNVRLCRSLKEVQFQWQSVISAVRKLLLASVFPILTDVPTELGSPTLSVLRLSLTVPRSVFTPAPVACVPVRLLAQYNLFWNKKRNLQIVASSSFHFQKKISRQIFYDLSGFIFNL